MRSITIYYFFFFFVLMTPPPPISTLFPYTTLFRSVGKTVSEASHMLQSRGLVLRVADRIYSDQPINVDPVRHAQDQSDRKSTRLNSSHQIISYAVFCLKKKNKNKEYIRPKDTRDHD